MNLIIEEAHHLRLVTYLGKTYYRINHSKSTTGNTATMPLEDWKKHNIKAVQNWHQGNHRKSATEYWLSFRAIPSLTHELRYHILHGYTTTIRGDLIKATDDDIKNMELVFRDKHEPRLYRLEAGYTLGVISYSRSERMKCQEYYHHAITIGEKEPKNAKQIKLEGKMVTFPTPDGAQEVYMRSCDRSGSRYQTEEQK